MDIIDVFIVQFELNELPYWVLPRVVFKEVLKFWNWFPSEIRLENHVQVWGCLDVYLSPKGAICPINVTPGTWRLAEEPSSF